MRVIGVDLAWREASVGKNANETGLIAVDPSGRVIDADWASGLTQAAEWINRLATTSTLVMVDAPLVVTNEAGQRTCERQVGQCYGRWKVSANSTNLCSARLAGVGLLRSLSPAGWGYHDGLSGPPSVGRHVSECYPYTTLVGAFEFGYDEERPVYKRKPKGMALSRFRTTRAANCDDLVQRLISLRHADPPLDVMSHPATGALAEASPTSDRLYKHREDLIDAAVCAWTGLLWLKQGFNRVQVLGAADQGTPPATIIAPARPEQRRLTP